MITVKIIMRLNDRITIIEYEKIEYAVPTRLFIEDDGFTAKMLYENLKDCT